MGRATRDAAVLWDANMCNTEGKHVPQFANSGSGIGLTPLDELIKESGKAKLSEEQISRHQYQIKLFHSYLENGTCDHLYLDIGTNTGVQLRKLYQPESFPHAPVIPLFDEVFGDKSHRRRVCAIGFEPNPNQNSRLDSVQTIYRRAGFPVVIFTETAVSVVKGVSSFYFNGKNDLGASLLNWRNSKVSSSVGTINIDSFIKNIVSTWTSKSASSKILAKMDIEGAEFNVIPHMLAKGSLCLIDKMMIEWHFRFIDAEKVNPILKSQEAFESNIQFYTQNAAGCKFNLVEIDDESYGGLGQDADIPFPK
jgi:hypothetical protein